jgi:hypothetical protein
MTFTIDLSNKTGKWKWIVYQETDGFTRHQSWGEKSSLNEAINEINHQLESLIERGTV